MEGVKAGLCLLFPGVCSGENCCGRIISSGEVTRRVGAWPGRSEGGGFGGGVQPSPCAQDNVPENIAALTALNCGSCAGGVQPSSDTQGGHKAGGFHSLRQDSGNVVGCPALSPSTSMESFTTGGFAGGTQPGPSSRPEFSCIRMHASVLVWYSPESAALPSINLTFLLGPIVSCRARMIAGMGEVV